MAPECLLGFLPSENVGSENHALQSTLTKAKQAYIIDNCSKAFRSQQYLREARTSI